jgi:hypothetical protein
MNEIHGDANPACYILFLNSPLLPVFISLIPESCIPGCIALIPDNTWFGNDEKLS